ncbi:integral membrane sensor signal transduction histidine kinase [Chlorobaculum parvum NCIB 8327]|uniref:histidine kinase n=1 Tax=Chlorobaculum parvum (strain DSM 263 / NCIMB 8327) TaxID=517417 RepID=B3QQM9_CHLP8|nr:integral membrane sensor signal transduction histidine kinase [Chlorobaculum parvum NCIB 8327]
MDGRKRAVNPSLQKRLTVMLAGMIVAVALIASATSFYFAYEEAKEFQDNTLRQIAMLQGGDTAESVVLNGIGHSPALVTTIDPETRIRILHFQQESAPAWFAGALAPGFHTLRERGEPMRVFIIRSSSSVAAVVQPTETRDDLATSSALHTLVPGLLMLPVMALLVMLIVRSGLKPLTTLSHLLDEQSPDQPEPLPEHDLPEEMMPFVHSINRQLARISVLIGQQRRFIADAAHELRSPLTALSLQAENLRQAGSADEMRARLAPLQSGIERARQLTAQLLNLARVQAQPTEGVPVDLPALARELIAEYLPLAEARGIDLGLDEPGAMLLDGNPESFTLILKNGLENALNYTQKGGTVTVRLAIENGDGVMEVIDDGPGIPESERERVFDAFYRSPGSGQPGSGLGLTIAREAARTIGGDLRLLPGPNGRGTVFRYRQRGRVAEASRLP